MVKVHGTACRSPRHRSVSWEEALEVPSPASHLSGGIANDRGCHPWLCLAKHLEAFENLPQQESRDKVVNGKRESIIQLSCRDDG